MRLIATFFLLFTVTVAFYGCTPQDTESGRSSSARKADITASIPPGASPEVVVAKLREAIEKNPDNASAYLQLGMILLQADDFENAEASLLQAIRIDEDNPDAFNQLGLVYVGQGEAQKAMASFAAALQKHPDHVEANYNMGNLALATRQMELALNFYRKVLALDPSHEGAARQLTQIVEAVERAQQEASETES